MISHGKDIFIVMIQCNDSDSAGADRTSGAGKVQMLISKLHIEEEGKKDSNEIKDPFITDICDFDVENHSCKISSIFIQNKNHIFYYKVQ